jgi:cytochrome c biogenesis protein CcdA
MDLSLFLVGAALLDSVSTSFQILVLIFLFSTVKPVRTSLVFIAAIVGAYFACGVAGLAFVDQLNALVKWLVPNLDRLDDHAYYRVELALGVIVTVAGPAWEWYRRRSGRPPFDNRWITVFKQATWPVALVVGVVFSTMTFPMAVPYIASIEKIAGAHVGQAAGLGYLALYDFVYAVPLLVPFGLFVVLREAVLPRLHRHAPAFNRWLTIGLLAVMGLVALVDAAWYFSAGHALMPTRLF